jgi:hypothetical protein
VAAATPASAVNGKASGLGGGAPPPPGEAPPNDSKSGGSQLVRVTVNLTSRSYEDLLSLAEATGLGKTDVINRALQVYALVERLLDQGKGSLSVTHADGQQERFFIL